MLILTLTRYVILFTASRSGFVGGPPGGIIGPGPHVYRLQKFLSFFKRNPNKGQLLGSSIRISPPHSGIDLRELLLDD